MNLRPPFSERLREMLGAKSCTCTRVEGAVPPAWRVEVVLHAPDVDGPVTICFFYRPANVAAPDDMSTRDIRGLIDELRGHVERDNEARGVRP